MSNFIESINYLIDDCFNLLVEDNILRRAWEVRISFAFSYIVLMSLAYMINSNNSKGFMYFSIVFYAIFVLSRLVFETIESCGEPFEEKAFYKFLF
jgi:hypothetical protein